MGVLERLSFKKHHDPVEPDPPAFPVIQRQPDELPEKVARERRRTQLAGILAVLNKHRDEVIQKAAAVEQELALRAHSLTTQAVSDKRAELDQLQSELKEKERKIAQLQPLYDEVESAINRDKAIEESRLEKMKQEDRLHTLAARNKEIDEEVRRLRSEQAHNGRQISSVLLPAINRLDDEIKNRSTGTTL